MVVSFMLCVIHTLHLRRISGLFPHQWNEQIDSCPSGHWRPSETLQAVNCLPQRRSLCKTMNKDTRGQNMKGENLSLLQFQERLKWMQKSNLICFELLLQKRFKMFWQVLQIQLTHHTGLIAVDKRIQIRLTEQRHRTWTCLLFHVAHNAICFRSSYRYVRHKNNYSQKITTI